MQDLRSFLDQVPFYEKAGVPSGYHMIDALSILLHESNERDYAVSDGGIVITPFFIAEGSIYELYQYMLSIQCVKLEDVSRPAITVDEDGQLYKPSIVRVGSFIAKDVLEDYIDALFRTRAIAEEVKVVLARWSPRTSYDDGKLCFEYC